MCLCICFERMKDYIFDYRQIITSGSFGDKTKLVIGKERRKKVWMFWWNELRE